MPLFHYTRCNELLKNLITALSRGHGVASTTPKSLDTSLQCDGIAQVHCYLWYNRQDWEVKQYSMSEDHTVLIAHKHSTIFQFQRWETLAIEYGDLTYIIVTTMHNELVLCRV